MAGFLFGLWGVFVVDVLYGLGQSWLRSAALVAVAVAPLAVIVADVIHAGSGGRAANTIAALAGAVSGYLTIMEFVARGLNYALQEFPWRVLGLPAMHRVDPRWFTLFNWKTVASAVLGTVGLAVVVSTSVGTVARGFPAPGDDFLAAHIAESDRRIASQHDAISQIGEHTYRSVLRVTRIVFLAVLFIVRVIDNVALVLLGVAQRVLIAVFTAIRWFAVPVACFSVASLLLLAMARSIVEYDSSLPGAYSAAALWGGLICTSVLVLGLCGAAFGLNAVDRNADLSFNAIAPTLLLGWLSYCTMTLAELALWVVGFALRSAGKHVTALDFGPVERLNLFFVLGFLAVIALPNLFVISFFRQGTGAVRAPSHVLTIASLACAALVTAVLTLSLGHAPIGHWVSEVMGSASRVYQQRPNRPAPRHPTVTDSPRPRVLPAIRAWLPPGPHDDSRYE